MAEWPVPSWSRIPGNEPLDTGRNTPQQETGMSARETPPVKAIDDPIVFTVWYDYI
ncbi:MAG: hypothetical protein V3S18_07135 [Dehalococcoidia bacterium]